MSCFLDVLQGMPLGLTYTHVVVVVTVVVGGLALHTSACTLQTLGWVVNTGGPTAHCGERLLASGFERGRLGIGHRVHALRSLL